MRRCLYALTAVLAIGSSEARSQDKPQDPNKTIVTKPVESWYRITRGDEPIGYAHEWITPVRDKDWAYEYTYEIQVEVRVGQDDSMLVSERLSATLNAAFLPDSLTSNVTIGPISIPYELTNTKDGRQVTITLPSTDRKTSTLQEGVEIHFTPSMMTYWLRQTDKLAKTGLVRTNFFYPSVDKTVPPTYEIKLDVAGNDPKRKVMDKESFTTKIQIADFPTGVKELAFMECHVDKYGRIVEISSRDVKMALVANKETAMAGLKAILDPGRRDPFRKDLVLTRKGITKGGPGKPVVKNGGERLTADKIGEEVTKVKDEIKKLEALAKTPGKETEAREMYKKILVRVKILMNSVDPQNPGQKKEIADLKDKLEMAFGGAGILVEEARAIYLSAIDIDARNDDLKSMEEKQKKLKDLKAADEFLGSEKKLLDQVDEWIADLEKQKQKVKDRVDLAKKKVVHTGTVMSAEGVEQTVDVNVAVGGHSMRILETLPFIRTFTLAVIQTAPLDPKTNPPKYYKVGDVIEGEGVPVELMEIQKFGIKVKYKDQVREISIKE